MSIDCITAKPLRALALSAIVLAGACSGHPAPAPSAPSPAPNPSQPPRPSPTPVTRHLNGVVRDENGVPVPGARLEMFASSSAPVVTDGNGYYDMAAALLVSGQVFGNELTITKAGYETTHAWVPGLDDTTQDFRVYHVLTLAAGDSVHLAIDPDNSLCGLDDEFRCRTIRVVMPSSGTLALETIADDPSNAFWLAIGESFQFQYPFALRTQISTSMAAGSTVPVQVLRPWQAPPAPQGFTLKTSESQLRPTATAR